MEHIKYHRRDMMVGFGVFSPKDDHILYIKKAGYDDIELYYVIMEDAYRTPTAEILSAKDIEKQYGITKKELKGL